MKIRVFVMVLFFIALLATPVWAIFCPNCGKEVGSTDLFCRYCGRNLTDTSESLFPGDVSVKQIPSPPLKTVFVPDKSSKPFQVTTHYLLVSGNRLYKDSLFWIAEVKGSQARVWSLDGPPYDSLIMGWVSLTELEKRSTLIPGITVYCVEPPPPAPTKVVVIERINFWHNWHPGHFSRKPRRRSRFPGIKRPYRPPRRR